MSVTQRLRAVAEAGSDPDNLAARAALLEGQGLAIEGQLNEALLAVDAARDAFVAASEPWLALRTDLGRMHILNELGQTTAAVHVGTELLRVADGLEAADESPGPLPFAVDWLRASCLTNLGVCHTFAGDYVAERPPRPRPSSTCSRWDGRTRSRSFGRTRRSCCWPRGTHAGRGTCSPTRCAASPRPTSCGCTPPRHTSRSTSTTRRH